MKTMLNQQPGNKNSNVMALAAVLESNHIAGK